MGKVEEISLNLFLKTMHESYKNGKRYCFILGAGASRSSGILTGEEMTRRWYDELPDRYTSEELREKQERLGIKSIKPTGKYYFDVYALRFFPDYKNGSIYLENAMERAQPSFGHYPLATHLAAGQNNLVITTNFDSLVEDALFIYTEKKPLVISHELLAGYINFNTKRPIVAKLHRGLFFDPLNRAEQVAELSEKWKDVLHSAFKLYTPVVIGYAGGDHSLMDFLKKDARLDSLYWCYCNNKPPEEIQAVVEKHKGCLVPIEGFDEMMYLLGREFDYDNPCERIDNVAKKRMEDYNQRYKELSDKLGAVASPSETQSQILTAMELEQADELKKLDEQIAAHPEDAGAYYERGQLYHRLGMYEKCIEDFSKVIDLSPPNANAFWFRGYAYVKLKNDDAALEDYCEALTLNELPGVYCNRGLIYCRRKEYDKALADFSRAIEIGPDSADYHIDRADAYLNLNRPENSLEDINLALMLGSPTAYAYNIQGRAYDDLKQFDKALISYTKSLQIDPRYDAAYNNRGVTYSHLGDYKRSFSEYKKAIKFNPTDPLYFTNCGSACNSLHRYKDAITYCNKALKLDSGFIRAYRIRANVYEVMGQEEKAQRDREKTAELEAARKPQKTEADL